MATTNTPNWLHDAGLIFKGELANNHEALKKAREDRNGSLLRILTLLICHASNNVFDHGYTKAKARRFNEDVIAEFGIGDKQASKWTTSISAALGVRGVRKGVQPIEGLDVAAGNGNEAVVEFLHVREIETFNQFMAATRTVKDEVQELAFKYQKLSESKRERLLKLVEKLDKDEQGDVDEQDAAPRNGLTPNIKIV